MKNICKKLAQFWSDIEFILFPGFPKEHRKGLVRAYVRIFLKNSLDRWFHFKHERFLGLHVEILDYGIFFETFRQVFVRQVYYMATLPNKAHIIDCGGNIGLTSLYFARAYPSASITTFEPSPEVIDILRKNIERNGLLSRITIHNAAVSDREGTAELFRVGTAACGNTIAQSVYESDPHAHKDGSVSTVETVLLSRYIETQADLVKLDIEGNEGAVIRELSASGAIARISRIALEYHETSDNSSNDLSELLGTLSSAGFRYHLFLETLIPSNVVALLQGERSALNLHAVKI